MKHQRRLERLEQDPEVRRRARIALAHAGKLDVSQLTDAELGALIAGFDDAHPDIGAMFKNASDSDLEALARGDIDAVSDAKLREALAKCQT